MPFDKEVANFQEADQMQANKSQFECGYFACAIARSMAPIGQKPTLTLAQVIADAESWYAQYDGSDAISNTNGMTLEQEYSLLQQIGLHYQALPLDKSAIKGWLLDGYPVLVAVTEVSVLDMALGRNPYPWNPAGTHVILLTGATSDGNWLVRDSANCTSLYDPNSLRPGPRTYNAARIQLVSATVVVPPWKPRPTSATPPTGGNMSSTVPAGWHDDGTTLTDPNGVPVSHGFRTYILANNWDPTDTLMGQEYHADSVLIHNTSVGPGARLLTKKKLLWYTDALGVREEPFPGWELDAAYKQIASLQAQLAQVQPPAPAPMPNVSDALSHVEAALAAAGVVATELGKAVPDLKQ